ncbi:hypothetical protein R1sor_010316 [Riccia sorocarpa]|uniref:Uncharacterized protein n=1 Tax=Riccia sorocarpa TaxID=122646 RepID=A0ABD3HXN3_9MARC
MLILHSLWEGTLANFDRREGISSELAESPEMVDRNGEEGSFINGYDVFLDVCLPTLAEQELRLKKKIARQSLGVDVCIVTEMDIYMNRPDVQEALHANSTNLNHSYRQCSSNDVLHYSLSNYSIDILPVLEGLLQHGLRVQLYRCVTVFGLVF